MSKSTPLLFFGTEDYSVIVLRALVEAGYDIRAVITKPDHHSGRGQKLTAPKVKEFALEHNLEVWQPEDENALCDKITESGCDWAVLVAYGKILSNRTLELFNGGIINVHPSLLPRWRGPSPVEAAIIAGDTETGVSIIKLSTEMDAGPVYLQETVALSGNETKSLLYDKLFTLGGQLLVDNLAVISDGCLQPNDQDESKASYCHLLKKEDGKIDFSMPAEDYERQVRAYLGFPRSSAEINGQHVIVTKARIAKDKSDGALVMPCEPGFLEIIELIAPSGKTMSGADFLRGHSASKS